MKGVFKIMEINAEKNYTIRRAVMTDMPSIDDLLEQVLNVHHRGRPDLFKAKAKKYTDEELEELLKDDKRPVFVYENSEGKILGYAFCVYVQHVDDNILTDIKSLYIDDLCVDENTRGEGVGRKLYEHVLDFAKRKGFYNVTLNVWALNENAKKFYEKMGLVPQKIGMEHIL